MSAESIHSLGPNELIALQQQILLWPISRLEAGDALPWAGLHIFRAHLRSLRAVGIPENRISRDYAEERSSRERGEGREGSVEESEALAGWIPR